MEVEGVTNDMPKTNGREIVLDMLLDIIEGDQYSHKVINQTLKEYQHLEKQERAFISHLSIGTVERYLTLDYVINQYASLPVAKMKPLIRNLLRLSVYQIMYMKQIPSSAVCNEAVKLAKKRKFEKLSGFINGVLRNILRNLEQIKYPDPEVNPEKYLEITYSTPQWLVAELLTQYDFSMVETILEGNMKTKETTIRCNEMLIEPQTLKEELMKEGMKVEDHEYLPYAFKISGYDYLEKYPTFQKGKFAVQDISSMMVCHVADIGKDDFVLDVCAAPGGKALHAAQKAKKVIARDLTQYKKELIDENILRLNFTNVTAQVWDATVLDPDLVEQADIVIADLPCSGLGVIGKKSDIKYKISLDQRNDLVELQRQILSVVQSYVKKGGTLIYSTCTIDQYENTGNRNWFMKHYDFEPVSIEGYLPESLQGTSGKDGYLQLFQGVHASDGFFVSKFIKR